MKIGAAQIGSIPENLEKQVDKHIFWIRKAAEASCDLVCFPELSLTGYEPKLAKDLALRKEEIQPKFKVFQKLSEEFQMIIMPGFPLRCDSEIHICQMIYQPGKDLEFYSKQILHEDEKTFFSEGVDEVMICSEMNIAPAVCYESLQRSHISKAKRNGAEFYLASVAKSEVGTQNALSYFPKVSSEFQIPVLMVNAVGNCDDFVASGRSGVWNKNGDQKAQLSSNSEALLLYDSVSDAAEIIN